MIQLKNIKLKRTKIFTKSFLIQCVRSFTSIISDELKVAFSVQECSMEFELALFNKFAFVDKRQNI